LPTPEELWLAGDEAALEDAARAAASRAPHPIRSGEAVPFLIAISDAPPDAAGAALRITAGDADAPAAPGGGGG
ncbi:MAG TPA: hypothetical protein VLU43_13260, partial [Anaeromyxobacteraceae bacterium]|nr:hypothetical protein [Anaeromyxobacteraceae bacterium]